jgi:hypothetical protein
MCGQKRRGELHHNLKSFLKNSKTFGVKQLRVFCLNIEAMHGPSASPQAVFTWRLETNFVYTEV